MKTIAKITIWAMLLVFLFNACKDDDAIPLGKYENGVLIINEGDFLAANGSISFWSFTNNTVNNDIFNAENGLGISATIQNTQIYNDNIYIVTNAPDKVEIVDAKSFKLKKSINTKLTNPFDFAAVGNTGYVSNWGSYDANYKNPYGSIKLIDLTNNTILTDSIAVGGRVMGLLALNNKVYVASEAKNKVLVINTNTNKIEKEIDVPSPSRFVLDANNKIWVISSDGKLVRINPSNNTVELTIDDVEVSGGNEKIAINKEKNKIYYLAAPWGATSKVFAIDITATAAPTTPIFSRNNLYGLGVSPTDNLVYVADANAFQSNGKVIRLNPDGTKKDSANVGKGPNGFLFR